MSDPMRTMPGGRALYLVEEGIFRTWWRIDWRVAITPTFQPRICWWRFKTRDEAQTWFSTFGTSQEPGIEWAVSKRGRRQCWHRLSPLTDRP